MAVVTKSGEKEMVTDSGTNYLLAFFGVSVDYTVSKGWPPSHIMATCFHLPATTLHQKRHATFSKKKSWTISIITSKNNSSDVQNYPVWAPEGLPGKLGAMYCGEINTYHMILSGVPQSERSCGKEGLGSHGSLQAIIFQKEARSLYH